MKLHFGAGLLNQGRHLNRNQPQRWYAHFLVFYLHRIWPGYYKRHSLFSKCACEIAYSQHSSGFWSVYGVGRRWCW